MASTHQYAGISANMEIAARGTVHSYRDGITYLDGQHSRLIASNVMVRLSDDKSYVAIVLYDTEIIRYYDDNQTFSVDNGGFATPTSASRVSQFTPPGYAAHHSHKRMVLNAHRTGHDHRFPLTRVTYQENN